MMFEQTTTYSVASLLDDVFGSKPALLQANIYFSTIFQTHPESAKVELQIAFFRVNISSFGNAGNSFVPPGVHLFIISTPNIASLASFCACFLYAFQFLAAFEGVFYTHQSVLWDLFRCQWCIKVHVVEWKRFRVIDRWCWGGGS